MRGIEWLWTWMLLLGLAAGQWETGYTMVVKWLAAPSLSDRCRTKLLHMLNHFMDDGELMAFIALSGKGINELGEYKGCNAKPNSTYWVLEIKGLPITLTLGFCSPKDCDGSDYSPLRDEIAKLLNSMFATNGTSPLSKNLTSNDVRFIDPKVERSEAGLYSSGFVLTVAGFVLVLCLTLAALVVRWTKRNDNPTTVDQQATTSWIDHFNLVKNYERVFGEVPDRDNKDLNCMNGIRFLCMLWVVLGHTFYYARYKPLTNATIILEFMRDFWHSYITNATFSVDVFFFFSGFLAFYLVMSEVTAGKGCVSFWRVYLHRAIRLAPILYALTFATGWIFPSMVEGPVGHQLAEDVKATCKETWYYNLLYITNMANAKEKCAGHCWYVSNDMQFFILVPIIAVLYYRSKLLGVCLTLLVGIGCMIATIAISVHYKLSASLMKFTDDYFNYFYNNPYSRIHTYLLGIFASMIYLQYKTKQPGLAYEFTEFIRKHRNIRIFIYLVSINTIFWLIHTMYWLNKYPERWSTAEDTAYLTLHKPAFIICVFFLVYPAMVGRARIVRYVFGASFFAPLAKLTYAAYLFHPVMMEYHGYREEKGEYFEYDKYMLKFYGYSLLAYVTSLILTPILESPFRSLSRHYLHPWHYPSHLESSDSAKKQEISPPLSVLP